MAVGIAALLSAILRRSDREEGLARILGGERPCVATCAASSSSWVKVLVNGIAHRNRCDRRCNRDHDEHECRPSSFLATGAGLSGASRRSLPL